MQVLVRRLKSWEDFIIVGRWGVSYIDLCEKNLIQLLTSCTLLTSYVFSSENSDFFFFYGGLRSKNCTVVPSFLPDIFGAVTCELLWMCGHDAPYLRLDWTYVVYYFLISLSIFLTWSSRTKFADWEPDTTEGDLSRISK